MLSTISSANTVAECSTPAGCSPGVLDRGDQALGDSGLGDVAGDHFDPAAVGGHLRDRRTDLVGWDPNGR